jgi:acetylornithine deacetylase/succinyl-diaminopimelate desuccinylase-like protein
MIKIPFEEILKKANTYEKDMTKFLRDMVRIPSESSDEKKVIQRIKEEMIKKDAVIIDIGITKTKTKVLGDVDFASVKKKAAFITPVPGGIGPLTIAFLFKNVLD